MRTIGWAVVAIAVAVVPAGAQETGAMERGSNPQRSGRGCSDATLWGTWGIQVQGTRLAPPPAPAGTVESVIGVVVRKYDGRGGFTQVANIKGSISGIVPDREGFGTYRVNADCTAVVNAEPAPGILIEDRLVIVDGGRKAVGIGATPLSAMVSSVHQRVFRVFVR